VPEAEAVLRGVVAIDGSKFKAVNNRDKNYTPAKLQSRIGQIEANIARYLSAMDAADAGGRGGAGEVGAVEGEDRGAAGAGAAVPGDGGRGPGGSRPAGSR